MIMRRQLYTFTCHSLFDFFLTGQEEGTAEDTISFGLKVKCRHDRDAPADATQPDILYKHNNVYTKDMVWIPVGNQTDVVRKNPVVLLLTFYLSLVMMES